MSKLDFMTDEEVINWAKKRTIIIFLTIISIILGINLGMISFINKALVSKFIFVAIIVYILSLSGAVFFINKFFFKNDIESKRNIAQNTRNRYRKK